MSVNYLHIYHNPLFCSLILASFIKGYKKPLSLNLIFVVLPIIFSESLNYKLSKLNKSSSIYSLVDTDYNIDIKKEIKLKERLTRLSLIYGMNNGYFSVETGFLTYNIKKLSYKSKLLNKFIKSANNLGVILGKLESEEEVLYHLYKF